MKRISLEELLRSMSGMSYPEQYRKIRDMLDREKIRPVRASGTNGKKPALYREYWVEREEKDYHLLEEELKFKMSPAISVDYYLKHPDVYEEDREAVLRLNEYLLKKKNLLKVSESVNERSFEIWGQEKFLSRGAGKKILKRCHIPEELLNMYATSEPFSYFTRSSDTPQNILILENKDTFYSMRRFLLEGQERILGIKTGTLIYGAGKRVLRSFQDFALCAEPYMKKKQNRFLYFGDMDYEGIGIYENLAELVSPEMKILPFVPAYQAMLDKAGKTEKLPVTKEQQNRNIRQSFFSHFEKDVAERMTKILEAQRYIPQEILNIQDFEKEEAEDAV